MENGLWVKPNERILLVDALRGFAIAAILLIHCSNNFLYSIPLVWSAPEWLLSLDSSVRSILYFIFEGKAYTIFALLFGFTYALQYENQKSKGKDFSLRMVWRMVLLIVFGIFNAAFFMGGDPLVFYALSMLLVIPLIKLNNRVLIVLAILLFAQPLLIVNKFIAIINDTYIDYYSQLAQANEGVGVLTIMFNNATVGLKACLAWAVETGRFTQTMALFILGILVYRVELFKRTKSLYVKLFIGSLLVSIFLYFLREKVDFMGLTMYYNLFSSIVLISLFVIIYKSFYRAKIYNYLVLYGKMSLTNFIGQSVICSILFYSWGFNLTAYLGATFSILLGFFVLIVQICVSKWWLKSHKKGPLEQLWHRLTWL